MLGVMRLIAIFLLLVSSVSTYAEEGQLHLTIYDSLQKKIADVWLEMPFEYPNIIPNKAYYGQWRGSTVSDYVNPHPGWVSAGDKLNEPHWKKFNISYQIYKDKKMLVLHLHETGMVEDSIVIYSPQEALSKSYKWAYITDGGQVDQGTYVLQ